MKKNKDSYVILKKDLTSMHDLKKEGKNVDKRLKNN